MDISALDTFRNSRTRWLDLPFQIFEIEAELGGQQYIYRLEIQFKGDHEPKILGESLKLGSDLIIEYSYGLPLPIKYSSGPGKPLEFLNPAQAAYDFTTQSTVAFLSNSSDASRTFCKWLQESLHCYRINPSAMETVGQYNSPYPLAFDTSNLPSFYRRKDENDKVGADQFLSSLKKSIEGLANLSFSLLPGENGLLIVTFDKQGSNWKFELNELSDGQKCLIALYMILHFLIAKGHTVILDEPDNYVSLREIQPWLLAVEEAVDNSKGQLILISHHPEILNQWSQEYGVQFVREENGQVRPPAKFKTDYEGVLKPSEVIARGWEDE
jgi:hypothetical protein